MHADVKLKCCTPDTNITVFKKSFREENKFTKGHYKTSQTLQQSDRNMFKGYAAREIPRKILFSWSGVDITVTIKLQRLMGYGY